MPDYPVPRGPAAAMFEADAASRGLGMELVHVDRGSAMVRMRVARQMINGHSICHGGYVFMLADTAFACACNSEGPVTLAAGADISFIAPAREGDLLVATATERARYGRSGIYDVTVRRDDEVVAEFRGRSRTVGRCPEPGSANSAGQSSRATAMGSGVAAEDPPGPAG